MAHPGALTLSAPGILEVSSLYSILDFRQFLDIQRSNPWFANLMVRILEGSQPVLKLMARNPFPTKPPKYVRALLFDYEFTNFRERSKTGDWWKRTPKGIYFGPERLDSESGPSR